VSPPVRFSVRAAQIPAAAFGTLIALLGLAGLTDTAEPAGSRIFGALTMIFGIWFVYRGVRSAAVLVTAETVTTRSFLRTRRYQTAQLTDAEVGVGQTGPTGFGREFLLLHLADGSTVRFKELNNRPSKVSGRPTVVQQAVAAIRDAIHGRRP
jgi:hypothetical protein